MFCNSLANFVGNDFTVYTHHIIVRKYVFTFFSKSKNATFYVFVGSKCKKRRKRCPSFHFSPLWNC